MLRRIGRSSRLARSSASGPQAYQSTGLFACCKSYGLVSLIRRLGIEGSIQSVIRDGPVRSVPFRFPILEQNRLRRLMPDTKYRFNGVRDSPPLDDKYQAADDVSG